MTVQPPPPGQPQRLPGGYQHLRDLGVGNTSGVVLARRQRDGAELALKLPLPATLGDPAAAERFGNEVRLSQQFRHPQLVVGLEGVQFGPGAYLAMPYFAGGTLQEHLGAALVQAAALRILADVAAGLSEMHRLGAVHQDVKTQNVYLHADGRAALGDFGSTFYLAQGGPPAGSPFYMAPEIYQGEPGSQASDVYSFGVLAYELLTGQRPHRGESYEALMVSHLNHSPVQLSGRSSALGSLPHALTHLLDRSLGKRAASRPAILPIRRELQRALGEVPDDAEGGSVAGARAVLGRHGPPPGTPAPPAPRRGWNPFRKKD